MIGDEMVIRICDDRSVRLEITEDGITRTKIVSPDILVDCIRDSLTGIRVSTGLLPEHTRSFTSDLENGQRYIVMEFPEERADVTYQNTCYPAFPLPRLLFGFVLESSGRIARVNLGVPALGKLTPQTPMFCYPFSNVSVFSLCLGANPMPQIREIRQLSNLPYFILSLPDNDDHFTEKNNRLQLSRRDLMEHLRDKDRSYYYEHILTPMPGKTLKDFL